MSDQEVVADLKPWTHASARPFVQIRGVTKKFGEFTAVDDVSLDIFKGELFCLLGGSGCGKSTLLRMLAGFEQPTAGSIAIDGQEMAGVAAHDRPTNMMFQSYALFPHMSVERNVAYGLAREGMPKARIGERVAEMLRMVKLEKFASRKPHQLSGGQMQRVALARSLVKRPKLLLLDEPLAALDKKLREETQFELIRIQETLGVTFIVVTHDQEEAMTLSTRIGVMDHGRIVQVGEPPQIYEQPRTRFVSDFIGTVNLFEGQVDVAAPDRMRIRSADAGGDLIVRPLGSVQARQTVWTAVRPERISLSRERPGDAENVFPGTVEEVAYRGHLSVYRIRLESGKTIITTRPADRRQSEGDISWDERVFATWDADAGVVLTE
ncbi:MAG: ABC transporter ATP-binding protein [Paracoccaceae bacterium]